MYLEDLEGLVRWVEALAARGCLLHGEASLPAFPILFPPELKGC